MVSVIIPYLTGYLLTKQCVESILTFTKNVSFEVIIVDNGSNDNSFQKLQKDFKGNKYVRIVRSEKNLGFGEGNNFGYKYARGNFLFFLCNDTLLFENSLLLLVSEYKKLEKEFHLAFLQPRLFTSKKRKKVQITASRIPTLLNIFQENFSFLQQLFPHQFSQFRYQNWDRNSSRVVEASCGAAMFCKRSTFEKLERFDKRYFVYFEEYDFAQKAKKNNLVSYYTTKTSIIHFHDKTSISYFRKKLIYLTSFLHYLLKYYVIFQ